MSEPENFLGRWSRRKRGEANEDEIERDQVLRPDEDEGSEKNPPVVTADGEANNKNTKEEEPEFDLSQLPSIESITASTDIRLFMLPGVPMALRQAALRKVWVTDPKIRDFIEMAENQWDFTADVPGFDFSAPTGDVKKMVAEILGGSKEKDAAPEQAATEEKAVDRIETTAPSELAVTNSVRLSESHDEAVPSDQVEENRDEVLESVAVQNNDAPQNESALEIPKRRHGSALPS